MARDPRVQLGNVRGLTPAMRRTLGRRARVAGRRLGIDRATLDGLGIRVVDDEEMARLHTEHMQLPGPTDVLSFPSIEEGALGDIVIDWDAVIRQARGQTRQARIDEATILLVHGLVHLLGHDHRDRGGARVMHRLERQALRALRVADIPRPYGARG